MKTKLLITTIILVSSLAIPQVFGIGSPPPERVPVSSSGIYDLEGNRFELINVGEQIQIQADLANAQDSEQSLAYIVEVYDKDEIQVFRGWIEATLGPMDAFSPAVSWIPEKPGYYTAKMMVWEALDNPSSLSPPLESEFYVAGDISALNKNRSCGVGKELVFKINYKKVACVFPETLVKLLGRGWANWHDWYSPLFIDNLRQGPQDVDEVHAEFVKREVMKDSDVSKHFLRAKNYDYTCCTYQYNENDYPLSYQLVINFSHLPNEKQLVVVYDLRQTKVVDTALKDMVQLGGPIITEPEPEPKRATEDEMNLRDARQKLREIYHLNSSFGPFKIKDAIVGYGIAGDVLVVDVLTEYYESDHLNLIKQKIRDIVGPKVTIEFSPSGAIVPTSIESVFPYVWNSFLHQNGIEFTPKEQTYANTDEGYDERNRVCSPIVAANGTEFYISSTFIYEPFEITGTFIDKTMPDDCHKIWKTDTILVEPDRILMLWLENYHKGN